ncbi:twin-arginine translocation signal domain-containing protein [Halosimplex halobium]|uniref:twin-arginine translocation signal domain-containing protein n=1 Tax=Halosimplex halobium TaxID=3396618 RepID=UPI003F576B3C
MEREPSRRRFVKGCCLAGAGALAASGSVGNATASGRQEVPPTRWERTYDRGTPAEANAVVPAGDGGFVVAGTTEPADGEAAEAIWLARLTAGGRIDWETTVAERAVTRGFDVAPVGDGFVVAGHTHEEGSSQQGAFAVRVDGEGTEQWRRVFNVRSERTDTVRGVTVDEQGRFVFVGWTDRFDDAWVVRMNPDQSIDWSETIGPGGRNQLHGVVVAEEGGYIAVGETDDTADDTAGWIVKLDDEGTQVFSQQFKKRSDDAINSYDDYNVLYDVAETRNGFVAVGANAFDPQTNDRQGWALEINVDGGKRWGTRVESDTYTVLRSVTGGYLEYYVAGETATNGDGVNARGFAANLGIDGETRWKQTYGSGSSEFSAFHLTDDEGMVCVGSTADSAGGPAAGWGVKVGGAEVATATPSPTPSPTASPTATPTDDSTPTFTPTPTDEPGTDAGGGATATATPTATPSGGPGTATRDGGDGGTATTAGDGGGGGLSPAVIGVGAAILAIGSAGVLYNRFLAGDDEGAGGDEGAPSDDSGGGGGDGGGSGVETTEPDTEGTQEVQAAQTVVDSPDGERTEVADDDATDAGTDDASGDEADDPGAAESESDGATADDATEESGDGDATDGSGAGDAGDGTSDET